MTHCLSGVHLITMLAEAMPLPIDVQHLPLPIDVQHLPPPDWFAILTLLVSVILAGVTGFLFIATRNMARETKRLADKTAEMAARTAELAADTVSATDQADRHHQQTLWPMVVVRVAIISGESGPPWLSVNCKNIGAGMCVAGEIKVTAINQTDATAYNMASWLPPCGAGEEIGGLQVSLAASGVQSQGAVYSLVFIIEYETMFGSVGRTKWMVTREQSGKFTLASLRPFELPEVIVPEPKKRKHRENRE